MTVLKTCNAALGAVSWDGDFKLMNDCFSCQCHAGSLLKEKFAWKRENTEIHWLGEEVPDSTGIHYICPQNDWDKKDQPV